MTPASKAVRARAQVLLLEKDEGVSDAAAEGHGADHNEVIGSSVVSLGPDERSVCLGVSSPELGSGRVITLNLHFGGRATILPGRGGNVAIKAPALSVIGEVEGK